MTPHRIRPAAGAPSRARHELLPRPLLILAILASILLHGSALALDHSGPIAADETWSAADNPHVIVANTTVNAGVTLTIEPGVEVRLGASRQLTVYGTLTAVGAPGQEILFTKDTASAWSSLYFLSAGDGTFQHCILEGASYALYPNSSGVLDVADTVLRDNSYGIYATGSNAIALTGCLLQGNGHGVRASGGSISLASCTFDANTSYGYRGNGVAPALLDAGNVFTGNATALYVENTAGADLSGGLSVTGSTTAGIHLLNCDAPVLDDITLTGNGGTYGALYLVDCGEFDLGANNIIGGPGLENSWPLSIGAGAFPAATAAIPVAGNTRDAIQVSGGNSARTGTWRRFPGLDYVVIASATVAAGGELVIEPGTEIRVGASRQLSIYGTLTAVGAPGQEILFTKDTATAWSSLYFLSSGGGAFQHCILEGASYALYPNSSGVLDVADTVLRDNSYGIYATGSNAIALTGCLLQGNGHGVRINGGSISLASCTFDANTSYGYRGNGVAPTLLDTGNVFTGNATALYVENTAGADLSGGLSVTGSTTAGIHLLNCDAPVLDDITLTGNGGTHGAFYLVDCGEFDLGANNIIGGPGLENSWPLSIGAGAFPAATAAIPVAGNTRDAIQVSGGNSARTGTWRRFPGLDYVVIASATVAAGGELVIEPGTEIRVGASRQLTVYGTLTAVGAPGQEILFTRDTASAWSSLYFLSGGSGTLQHCILEGASYALYPNSSGVLDVADTVLRDNSYGIYATGSNAIALTGCLLQGNGHGVRINGGSISLASCTFDANTSYGYRGNGVAPTLLDAGNVFTGNATALYVENTAGADLSGGLSVTGSTAAGIHLVGCDAPVLDDITLTGNGGTHGAFYLVDCGEFDLGANNIIGGPGLENSWPLSIGAGAYPAAAAVIPVAGNTRDAIQVAGGSSARTGTWRRFPGLDYVVTGNLTVAAGGELALEPAVAVRFVVAKQLAVYGTLTAVGAPGQEILFTRDTDSNWSYLYFPSAGGGALQHCIIEHASYGLYAATSDAIDLTATTIQDCSIGLYITDDAAISLTDCLVRNNGTGLRIGDGTVTFLRSQIVDNDSYGVDLRGGTPVFGQSLAEWNDIHGNGSGAEGRDLKNDVTDITAAYVHWGTMDHAQILTRIWDFHDDRGLGYVQILPYVNAAHDDQATAVDDLPDAAPAVLALHGNVPNPFNPVTEIRFDLPAAAEVRLEIFDLAGAHVATLIDGELPSGTHAVPWRGADHRGRAAPSGVYLSRLSTGGRTLTHTMMLMR